MRLFVSTGCQRTYARNVSSTDFSDEPEIDYFLSTYLTNCCHHVVSFRLSTLNTWQFVLYICSVLVYMLYLDIGIVLLVTYFDRFVRAARRSIFPQRIATPIYPIWFEVSPSSGSFVFPIPLQLPVSHSRFSSISVTYISPALLQYFTNRS